MIDPHMIASKMNCPYCSGSVHFKSNEVIYGRPYGSGFAYICDNFPACDSFVGCHGEKANEETRWKPFGTLANRRLRDLRKSVHAMIDPYHELKIISRKEVYAIMAMIVNLPPELNHVGMFDEDTCKKVLAEFQNSLPARLQNYFLSVPAILPRKD